MKIPIPCRPCCICGVPTSEVLFVKGVGHKSCYGRWVAAKFPTYEHIYRVKPKSG